MLKNIFLVLLSALALPLCAQAPEYKAAQYSGYINRFYTLCFDTENVLWTGGPSNGLPYGAPNGVLLHRVDANLNLKAGRNFNAEPDIEYPAEIGWDAGDRIIGCGNYQDGGFGTGFVFRFRPQTTPSQLLFLKKIEGGEVRLSGLIENTADTSLIVYGTSLEGGVQRGELFRFQRNTGVLRPGFPKRYSVGEGLSFDAAILHAGRLYTAGACSLGGALGGNSTTFGLSCLDAVSGQPLWFASNPAPAGQPMHLEARDLIFTDDDGDALLIVGSGDDQHSPAQSSHIFLQKSRLDGTLMWIKKIDLPDWTDEFAEEVVAVSDGYLVFGHSRNPAEQGVFLLKTDGNGKPMWAKRILQGSGTGLPDWPAQAQMLVRNEAIYLGCNALVATGVLSPPNVGLLFKLQLDGTLANCSTVQPTPAVNLPFDNLGSIALGLSASLSPLQANTATGFVPTGISGTFSPGTICQQTGYVCNDRPDLTARVDSAYCSSVTGGLGAAIRLCNVGKTANQQGFYVSFYDSNPLSGPAKRVFTQRFFNYLEADECAVAQFALSQAFKNNTRYYTLVGADTNAKAPILLSNFPLSGGFPECDYSNNLDSFVLNLPPECFPTDCAPTTYLRLLGAAKEFQSVASIRASGDGNLYMAGYRKGRPLIAKMTPEGKFLWARSFSIAPFEQVTLAEIIVDSEGMIVGCGRQGTGNSTRSLAFRYDPNADQMLWVRLFDSIRPGAGGILEKNPSGNYLLYQSLGLPEFLVLNAEILELDRTTGQIVPGFAQRYQHGYSESFTRMVMHDGALYATGFVDSVVNNELARRTILTKMNPNTGEPLWSRMGHIEWERPAYLQGYDLLVDDNHLLTMYYGSEETYRINQGDGIPTYTFLQKSTLDGEVLWTKRYRLNSPKELTAVPDGYIISAGSGGHTFLKVDKNGNPVNAQRLTGNTGTSNSSTQQQNRVERIGTHLFLTNHGTTSGGTYQHTMLLKTDLNLNLDYGCNGYVPTTVQDSVPAVAPTTFPAPQTLRPSTATQQTPVPVFAPDTVAVQKTECPICPDSVCTDLTARVDSLTCLSAGAYTASVSVCNLGAVAPDTGFYLTFYDKNPLVGGAAALQSVFWEGKPAPGACVQTLVPLDAALLQQAQIFTLVGADGNVPTPVSLGDFPLLNGFAECDYANNLDSFLVKKPDCGSGGGCSDAQTFIKKLGSRLDTDLAFSICKTADGNLYLAGRKNPVDLFIAKMNPGGEVLWMRKIPAGAPTNNLRISEIMEDSDGKIVFSATQGITPNTYNSLAMRYDPVGDSLIWFKFFGSARPASTGILEKGPGGNFLLSTYAQVNSTGRVYTRIWEVERNTGVLVPGAITADYEGGFTVRFERMVARPNSLYATGARQPSSGAPTLSMLTKLSALTGDVEWAQATTPDSTASGSPDVLHTDLEFDGDFALMTGSGLRDAADPAQGVFAYLEKHAPDGSLLWLKRYDVSMRPEDVLALPDAYVIFGKMADNRWGLLKTDKEGNPLIFKTLSTSAALLGSTLSANRQGQIFSTSDHIYMADHGPMTDDPSAIWLLKTDHNFDLDNACDLLQPASVQATTMPAKTAFVPLARTKFIAGIADAGVIYEKDSLQICGICPACPCCAPDLTARVDSIGCSLVDGIIAHVSICNLGEMAPDTGFHLTFYDKNPLVGGAVALQSVFVEGKPAPGACVQAVVPLEAALLQQPHIFTLVGADGNVPTPVSLSDFPLPGGFAECSYANNLDSFLVKKPDCAPDSCHPSTFWKIFGRQGNWINISALRAAPDGNLYMAGRQDDHLTIGKMAPDGQFVWMRSLTLAPLQRPLIAEIIVDSEGMIVGSGNLTAPSNGENKGVFAFRYNPTTHQVLWVRNFNAFRSTEGGILEKTPSGNFLLHYNITTLPGQIAAEILELDRTTGQIAPAFAKRYEYQYSQAFSNVVAHDGAIYATGYTIRKVGNSGFRRMVLLKMDASTGDEIWSRTGLTDWPQASDFTGGDLIVDDNCLLALYYGSETTNNAVGNAIKLYLQKTTLDGEVLWVKKYDLAAFPKELVATPDGYIIFGSTPFRTFLKTDKEGNLLVSKRLETPSYFVGPAGIGEQNQAERIGQHLYFAHETARSNQIYGYTTLLKTDLNLEMDFDCALSPFPITHSSVTVQPNIVAPQTVTASPALQGTILSMLGPDSVILHKSCPTCTILDCNDRPDLTARVDSITCSSTDGAIAHLSVCNLGETVPDTGFYLTFYDKNPLVGSAVALRSIFFAEKPTPGACVQLLLPWDAALLQQPQVFTLVGTDGNVPTPISLSSFPFSNGYAECDYANNLDSFTTVLPPIQKLDLGPDRSICPGQTVTLDAGSGYATYQWVNGPATQTYTVSTAGHYIAEVADTCGRVQRDTVQVTVLPYFLRSQTVVLLPGESITINGKSYTGSAVVQDTVPTLTGGCDTLVSYQIQLDSLHCQKAESFIKTYKGGLGRVVRPSADGGYYIGGEVGGQATISDKAIAKLDAAGKILWTRTFDFLPNFVFDALIEDSEGRLVVLATSLAAPSSIAVFRYDPVADQVLWIKHMAPSQTDVFAFDLFEKSPGDDFQIAYRLRKNNTELSTEICSLNRTTGNLVGGVVWHYEPHAWVNSVALHQNALYANGLLRDPADPGVTYRYGLMKIDLNTGEPLWTRLTTPTQPGLDLGSGAVLVDNAGDVVSTVSQPGKAIGLQKTTPSGALVWLKEFQFSDPLANNLVLKNIVLLKDGYLFAADALSNATTLHALFFIKTDFNGGLVWAKKLPVGGTGYTYGNDKLLAVRDGKGCFLTNAIHQGSLFSGMELGQMDADGNLGEGCTLLENVPVTVSNQAATQDPALVMFSTLSRTVTSLSPTTSKTTQLLTNTICSKCLPPCEDVAITKTITFYPGDTITIDGVAYTQSATVVQNFTTPAGCDSVVTNILQLVITEVKIDCPADLTVTLPPNETTTVVDYPLPTATTDCPDPTITIKLLQGLPVGGSFPQGKTLVCYEAANTCGIRDTCCFTLTAELPDSPCDVKSPPGCVRYDLLGIRLDSIGQRRYRVRMTNTCASPLEFAYIQLPNGVLAISPQQGTTYAAPSGNAYAVRNPNASPFYSVRYEAVVENLNNGKSDIFEYTLPQQSAPAYIRVAARLADGTYSEAHLNTYNCPEVMENLEFRMENEMPAQFSILNSQLSVRPNPTEGLLFVDVSGWQGQSFHLQVLNAQGQTVVSQQAWAENGLLELALPANVVNGLYYLTVQPESGERKAVRFVVER